MAYNNQNWNNRGNQQNNNRYDGRPQGHGSSGRNGGEYGQPYVGAPYNFVPFHKSVVKVEEDRMAVHGCLQDDLLSGEIEYTIAAKTDILVDDGTGYFHKNAWGKSSIPGSTMRGLIRSNVQILGLSSFDDDIDDYTLMYRNVANGAEKDRYNKILGTKQIPIASGGKPIGVLLNVKGGYILKEKNQYYIYKTVVSTISSQLKEMNYYVLSERTVTAHKADYPYLVTHPQVMQHQINSGFKREEKNGRVHYKGIPNKEYIPGYYPVSYEVANLRNVSKLGNPGVFSKNGYLVATGKMNEKKVLYVIPEIDVAERIQIPESDVKAFRIDYESKKNSLKVSKNEAYFDLPKDGETKPVFYIEIDGRLYFGFTPRLRLFYDQSVKKGYKQAQVGFDYAKSIFGCITKTKEGYKTKVSFSDAVLTDDKEKAGTPTRPILSSPKPTSYLDYLTQGNGTTTYNSAGFELRGVKQYWLHKQLQSFENSEKTKIANEMHPLKGGSKFAGKVRFQNLNRDELGLLLWAIRLNGNSSMNVGKAKAYGYGVIEISNVSVRTIALEKAYSLTTEFSTNPMVPEDVNALINCYKQAVNAKLNGKCIDELLTIKTFFAMKDSTKIPDNSKIRYMSIDASEYQHRYKAEKKGSLKTVSEMLKI